MLEPLLGAAVWQDDEEGAGERILPFDALHSGHGTG